MVCIDQETADKNEEPFVTLSKTRKIDGRVLFGMHSNHVPRMVNGGPPAMIRVGDVVKVHGRDGEETEASTDEESITKPKLVNMAWVQEAAKRRYKLKGMFKSFVAIYSPRATTA